MKKDERPFIKAEIEDLNKYMYSVNTDIEGTDEEIENMMVSLLSEIAKYDKKLVVKILMKFMEVI